jgi:DNA-binding NarL/FixJ family response regulator
MRPGARGTKETMRRLRLVLADDHGLMVEAVKLALDGHPELDVVGVAETGSQVLPLAQQTDPDLIVLDLRMPGMDGLTCIRLLQERMPAVKIAVLSGIDSDEVADEALRLGASAFIAKRIDPAELPDALLAAYESQVGDPIGRLEHDRETRAGEAGLTERELEILRAVGEGKSNREIGKQLWLAEQTVKFHLTNIYRKLGVSSRTEALRWAYGHGVVDASVDSDAAALLQRSGR